MSGAPVSQGDILAGKYRVDRVLGMGGMGVVVAATHLDLLEPRAIKFMLTTALGNAEAVERFLREARAAARLKSEHVARVHDVGRLENGAPYMVMEYLEGADLDSLLKSKGPFPASEAAIYAIQACSALAEAHALGIIHRDLKPANLFLTQRGDGSPCVKVLDFGISKMPSGASAGSELEMTKTHTVLGSPHYMSPEQMRSSRNVDARSDVWSLGVILYKLTTGKHPFRGQNITELITAVLEGAPTPPSQLRVGLPQAFDGVVARCLCRKPDERFQTVSELGAALSPFIPPGAFQAADPVARLLAGASSEPRPRLDSLAFGSVAPPSLTPQGVRPSMVSYPGDPSADLPTGGTFAVHSPAGFSPGSPGPLAPVPRAPIASVPPGMGSSPFHVPPPIMAASPGAPALTQMGEPTGASWGSTAGHRGARSRLLLGLAGLVAAAGALALILAVRAVASRHDNEESTAAAAPATAAEPAPPRPAEAPPPPPPEPAITAIPTAEPIMTAPEPTVAPVAATSSPKPRATTVVAASPKAPPPPPGRPKIDPFGSGRK